MVLSLHTWWCFSVWYILLQRWSLVSFKRLHKCTKLLCLEFKEPLCFLNNVVVSPKNWCVVHFESQMCNGTNFFLETITAEVYRDIIQQFIALLRKNEHDADFHDNVQQHVAKDTMSFLAEFFGERICKWLLPTLDLSLLDIFLWSYLKNIVIRMLIEVLQSSRKQFEDEIREIDTTMYWVVSTN